ncbi:MAG: SGNH/GDSL hydrolase family protein [Clostridiales bacterium]|nr:SGNH/GDSL hydrolase family protein [Clostridiales bacterium]
MIKSIKKAIVWGDSVLRGVAYDEERGRYAVLRTTAVSKVSEELGIEVINRAKMGMTIEKGLELIEADLNRGIVADAALIEFGGNDCDFNWAAISENPNAQHLPKTPIDIFEKKLKHIVTKLRGSGIYTALATLPPIVADKYFDFIARHGLNKDNILQWLGDKHHIYRFHEMYSNVIQRVARECGCALLDLRSAFLSRWDSNALFCKDGIHPNQEGQIVMGEFVLQEALPKANIQLVTSKLA